MTGCAEGALQPAGSPGAAEGFYLGLVLCGVALTLALLVRWRRTPPPSAPRIPMPPSPLSEREALGLGGLLLALFLAAQAAVRRWTGGGGGPGTDMDSRVLVAQSLLFHGAILLSLAAALFLRRTPPGAVFGLNRGGLARAGGRALVFYLLALPHVALYGWLSRWGLHLAGHEVGPQPVMRILAGPQPAWLYAYLIGLAVILAPVAEEAVFRGIALPLLARRLGRAPAVLLVSLVFALMHAHLPSLAPLFVLGVAFAIAYLQTGNLAVPILMHALFNAVHVGLLLYLARTA